MIRETCVATKLQDKLLEKLLSVIAPIVLSVYVTNSALQQ